jgi:hypothetical protein
MRGEKNSAMKKISALSKTAIIVAIIMLLLGVYYLIPHIWHPYVFLDHPFFFVNSRLVNYNAHKKYTAIFFAIAVLALLCAYLVRPKKISYN